MGRVISASHVRVVVYGCSGVTSSKMCFCNYKNSDGFAYLAKGRSPLDPNCITVRNMPRPKGVTHSTLLQVRVSDTDKAAIRHAAELAGLTLSAYVRSSCLAPGDGGVTSVPPSNDEQTAALVYELNRIGVNLNQLTKQGYGGENITVALAATLEEIREALQRATGA